MKKIILLFTGLAFLIFKNQAQTVADIDGNVYNTVTIGTQVWMKENLKVSHYNNGNAIPLIKDSLLWSSISSGAYCYYNNDSITFSSTYGKIYSYCTTIDSRKVCPAGWHAPSEAEWEELVVNQLGGLSIAGGSMKETGTSHWVSPNTGATNSCMFTGLPGGFRRGNNGTFGNAYTDGYWFTTTYSCGPLIWNLSNDNTEAYVYGGLSRDGCSIRCVKDIATEINENDYDEKIEIFPNPTSGSFQVDCAESMIRSIEVYDLLGGKVFSTKNYVRQPTVEIDISDRPDGIYFVKCKTTKGDFVSKVIKQ